MLRIQKLSRPNKRSGNKLEAGFTTKVKGLVVTNQNSYPVYVDKFSAKKKSKKKKK